MTNLIITVTCDTTLTYPHNPHGPKPNNPTGVADEYVRAIDAGASICHTHGSYTSDPVIQPDGRHLQIPIMDGSAVEFCQAIEEAGIEEQGEGFPEIVIDRRYSVEAKNGEAISIEPSESFSVHYQLRYPEPVGEQEHTYVYHGPEFFKAEIAAARTFGFLRDIEKLQTMGLAGGGKLNNCIIIGDDKIINTELRYPDELARHKILDILGDLYLLGRPIRGSIDASMTGHSDNVALLRQIRSGMNL